MNPKTPKVHDQLVRNYYQTTSARGAAGADESFPHSLTGLARRLGPWFDVEGHDVIDLGSGTGQLCALAQQRGASQVTGVNLSEEEVAFARKHCQADFVVDDIAHFLHQQDNASADRIYALNILEHLDKDTLLDVLEQALRVLRPGGRLVAMVPNAISPFGSMTRYWDFTHYNAFVPSSVRQLANLVGFAPGVDFRECGPVAHGLVSGCRYLVWQLIRGLIATYLLVELASTKGGIYSADMMFRLHKPEARD